MATPATGTAKKKGTQSLNVTGVLQTATITSAVRVAAIHDSPANANDALVYAASSSYKMQMNFSVPVKYDPRPIISIFDAWGFTAPNFEAKEELRFTLMPSV